MSNLFKRFTAFVSAGTIAALSIPNVSIAADSKFPLIVEGEDMEDAVLWTEIYADKFPGYSGEGFTYLTSDPVSFKITVPEDAMYQITVRGLQILDKEGGRMETVAINGVEYSKIIPYANDWTDFDFGMVRLKKGENTISFLNKYGYMAIDYVTVSEAVFPDISGASGTPCDKDATAETKSLMKYLKSIYGKGILAGQQEIYGSGHTIQTDIRYDKDKKQCVDGEGNVYKIDEDSKGVDKDGNEFYWHCSDENGRVYDYSEQNRNYVYVYYDQEIDYLTELTGKSPSIRGFDLMNYNPLYGWDDGSTTRLVDWVTNKNGIATVCWHLNIPTDFDSYELGEPLDWSACSYKNNSSFKISKAVTKGTKENDFLNLCIKDLAEQFLIAQDAGAPIIFRPFHEAEGNGGIDGKGAWFWWSQDGAEDYKELWKYLYNELTETYGVHNLIWEQNLYAWSDESGEWYVGDDYVDIVGFDKYDTVYNRHDGLTSGPNEDCNSDVFWSLNKFVDSKKMIAMPENSTIPSLKNIEVEKATWLYFCTWYDNGQDNFISGDDYNNQDTVKEMFQSDFCITLDELPADLYSGSSTPPTTTAPSTNTPAVTTTVSGENIIWGDANTDGEVTVADAAAILQYLGNSEAFKLSELGKRCADCYDPGDGITPKDAITIQKLAAKLITQLPYIPE